MAVFSSSNFKHFKSPVWTLLASIIFVGSLLAVLMYFGVHRQLLDLLEWVNQQGIWADVLFIGIMVLVVILLLPGVFFTTGAGFVFGIVEGTVLVVVGMTIGSVLAFLIARYCFGKRASAFIREHGKLYSLNEEMAQNDFKIILLTRLIPFFPGKLSNYFFGLTTFSLNNFTWASLIGFIPLSLHNVYLGSLAADFASLSESELGRTPLQWGLYTLGFLITVFTLIYVSKLARRALNRYTDNSAGELP